MNSAQPFLELDKKRGALRLTLGASFGRVLVALALMGSLLCVGKNLSADQVASVMKMISGISKVMP